jgi:hypothetical protein
MDLFFFFFNTANDAMVYVTSEWCHVLLLLRWVVIKK